MNTKTEVKFVDAGNREFLEEKIAYPTSKQEILTNLADSSGVRRFNQCNNNWLSIQFATISLLTLSCGISIFLKVLLEFFIHSNGVSFEDIPFGLLMLAAPISLISIWGYWVLLASYTNERHKYYVNHLWDVIVKNRWIAIGQVLEVVPGIPDLAAEKIIYTFVFPATNEPVLGEYRPTDISSDLAVKDRVYVLYLNRRIRVLL